MKKLAILLVVSALSLFCATTTFAKISLGKLVPSKDLAVFTLSDNVSYNSECLLEEDTSIICKVNNFWGESVYTNIINLQTDTHELSIDLGKFDKGWYRLSLTDIDGNDLVDYCAFSVVDEPSDNKTFTDRIAIDLAGQYMPWNLNDKNAYARALKLTGVGMVRERMTDTTTVGYDSSISEMVDVLHNNRIDVLEMLARNNIINYSENLFDTYSKSKQNAQYYEGKVGAWESVNEPDSNANTTPDEVASFFKARSIGVLDAGTGAVKTFGGLCIWNNDFCELFLQNDVLKYSDNFNMHSHKVGKTTSYNEFPSNSVLNARTATTSYAGGKPIWVSEAGLNCKTENGVITNDYILQQAKYVITSIVESIARAGTDRHFFFLFRHLIENGVDGYGMFTENNMPYASYNSFATLMNTIGEAHFKGELRGLSTNCKGYMFNDGTNDVAVAWATTNKKNYLQLNTSNPVEVIDIMGRSTLVKNSKVNNKVNLEVSEYPIIVKFSGENPSNYYSKSFPDFEAVNVTELSQGERIVLKQNWKNRNVNNALYNIEPGKNYIIALDVYNFNSSAIRGTINANASDALVFASASSAKYSVGANSKTTLTFIVKANPNNTNCTKAYLTFNGNANDEEITPSVAGCKVGTISQIATNFVHTKIDLFGVYEGQIFEPNQLVSIHANVPKDLADVKVYVNYVQHSYTISPDGTLNIRLKDISEGAYNVMVTGFDKFNYAVRNSVNFYRSDKKSIKGTFFR